MSGGERALRAALAGQWEFVPPPEAPVFSPTREEFRDPLAYIAKIRHLAEPFGICRIRPPDRWQPPFALDVDNLRFTPRVQRLNELEGLTRLKLHFRDRLQCFWRLNGNAALGLEEPTFKGKPVDLFTLYHGVRLEGGHLTCTASNKWPKIATSMGLGHSPEAAVFAKDIYQRTLLPFHTVLVDEKLGSLDRKVKEEVKPEGPAVAPGGMMRRIRKQKMTSDSKCSRELRRLACYGAGPKMPGSLSPDRSESPDSPEASTMPRRKRARPDQDPLAIHPCQKCGLDIKREEMVECEDCSDTYHPFCVELLTKPTKEWRCMSCIAYEVKKPAEPFGFAQAEKEYTLQEFGTMADKFKADYFNMAGHLVSPVLAEKEFWRIVTSTKEDVTVEYGADLHSMDHGSGFPTKSSLNLFAGDQEYVDSGWNLNNLPVLENSVLRFINDDISGMTVPWMYVGMCFSSFCWHNEDHWSYSINFLHWGEPKTWYGVPGNSAELLESTMKSITPELFQSQPDLLHQLVTILNPNVLSEAGVPIYRTDQSAGEFVVTFPRSYHAGFNQGYNFAEAVNFAPPDWIPIGRECVLHYKSLKRFCVFSHDELICKMALAGHKLELAIVIPTYKELYSMVMLEAKQRGMLYSNGVKRSSRRQFELLSDDERLCEVCKTTCFLSALCCENCPNMVCLDHMDDMCSCKPENYQLLYRYTLDELNMTLDKLKVRIGCFDGWMTAAKKFLNSNKVHHKMDDITSLLNNAEALKIPNCKILNKLKEEFVKMTEIDKKEPAVIIELDD